MAKKKRERSESLNNNSKKQKQDEISEAASNNSQNLEIELGLTEDEVISDSEIIPAKLKPRKAQEWIKKNYPKEEEKKREREIDISDKELEGELDLSGFSNLQYLICRNNKLTNVILDGCQELVSIDCRSNELEKITLNEKLKLKEFRASNNKFNNINDILNYIDPKNLTYFDISYNNISEDINVFKNFLSLQSLYINNSKFSGYLDSLEESNNLFDIDIRNTDIKIENLDKLPKNLEEIYHDSNKNTGDESTFEQKLSDYYNEEDKFYDIKSWRQGEKPRKIRIDKILKNPFFSNKEDRYKVSRRIDENYEINMINYHDEWNRVVHPIEMGFRWKIGEPLQLTRLPMRVYCVSEPRTIKKRVDCIDDNIKNNYAILSYSWGGKAKEDIIWSPENAKGRLSRGGQKALKKAIRTLEVLKEKHKIDIGYLWMDQLCINQNDEKEKGHEIPRMRQYYGDSSLTLVPINANVGEETIRTLIRSFEKGESGLIYPSEVINSSLPILEKIIGSEWFSRSWTFQEGFLSKQTIFMFDDYLIDGRFMALIWKLRQVSEVYYEECMKMKELCGEKAATPVGWTYWKEKYSDRDKVSLGLNEALWAVKKRDRSIALDGIYSIIGLLTYGRKIKVDYAKDPESVLREVMFIAAKEGHGEPLAWHGSGSRTPGLCWMPEIDKFNGSSSIEGVIKVKYDYEKEKEKLGFEQNKGIKIKASEYEIIDTEKSSGIYSLDKEGIVDGNLWTNRIWIKAKKGDERIKLTLSGTKEGIKAIGTKRVLLVPNEKEWQSDIHFAILALKIGDNICHRIDLVRIEEGYDNENLKEAVSKGFEEEFVIGLNNQRDVVEEQLQAQTQIPPK